MGRIVITVLIAVTIFMVGCSSEESNPAAPIQVTGPTNLRTTVQSASVVSLGWTDNSDNEDGFKIARSTAGSGWTVIATLDNDVEAYVDSNLAEATAYNYFVAAFKGELLSSSSDSVSCTTRLIAPTNAVATTESVTRIAITWEDLSNAETGYQVERRSGGVGFALAASFGANTTAMIDSGLNASTTYAYRVRAIKDGIVSEWSSEASTTTFRLPPNAPSALRVSLVNVSTVQLNWRDNSSDEDGFKIERSITGVDIWELIATVRQNLEIYSDTGLTEGTGYQYRIYSYFGGSNSTIVGPVGITMPMLGPTNLVAARESESSISLSWNDLTHVETGYEIARRVSGGGFQTISTRPANSTTFVDEGLTVNTTYYYRTRAVQDTLFSAWSNEAQARTNSLTPIAPSDLVVIGGEEYPLSLVLNWTDNADNESGFIIEMSLDGNNGWSSVDTVEADTTHTMVGNIPNEESRFFRVYSINEHGRSDYSNSASGIAVGIPAAPGNLVATGGQATPTRAVLSWSDNSMFENGFVIEMSPNGNDEWANLRTVGADVVTFTASGLPSESTRYFRLYSFNSIGRSDYTGVASAPIFGIPPPASDLEAAAQDFRAADLDWRDNSQSEAGFLVQRRLERNFIWITVDTAATNITHHADSTVTPGTSYVYRIAAFNSAGIAAFSNEATVNVPVGPPVSPSALQAEALDVDRIAVAWYDRSNNESSFFIDRKGPDEEDFSPIGVTGPNEAMFTDSTCLPENWYTYRVCARNDAGYSDWSDSAGAMTLGLVHYDEGFERWDPNSAPGDPWTVSVGGSSWARVTTTRPHEGEKSFNFHDPDSGANFALAYSNHRPLKIGSVTAWLYIPDNSHFGFFGANPGLLYTFQLQFNPNDSFIVRDGGGFIAGGSYPRDEWFKLDVVFNMDSSQYIVLINDEQMTEPIGVQVEDRAPNSVVGAVAYNGGNVVDAFVDDIYIVRDWEPPEGMQRYGRPRIVVAQSPGLMRVGSNPVPIRYPSMR